jgi:hypothetical protein
LKHIIEACPSAIAMPLVAVALLMGACASSEDPDDSQPVDPYPLPSQATLTMETTAHGVGEEDVSAFLYVLTADLGETCVTSWLPRNVTSMSFGALEPFPIPAEPADGMVYALPADIPQPGTDVPFYVPPVLGFENGDLVAWFGGTWTFTRWSLEHVEVELAGGQTCHFDLSTMYADIESCVADAGHVVFDNANGGPPLEVEDPGYRGEPTTAIDPASGEPLCHRVTTNPPPTGGDGE